MRCRVLFAGISGVLASACSLLTDFSGLAGDMSAEAGAASDAADSGGPGPVDATIDGSGGQDGSGDVTATTGDAGSDAPPTAFCASFLDASTSTYFCADFDEADWLSGWKAPQTDNGSSVTRDTTDRKSAPASARFELPMNAHGCSYVSLVPLMTFPDAGTTHFEAQVYIDPDDAGINSENLALLSAGMNGCILYIDVTQEQLTLHEQANGPIDRLHPTSGAVRRQVWSKVAIDADYAGGTVSAYVADVKVLDRDPLSAACTGSGPPWLSLGFNCVGASVMSSVRYDNVVMDVR